MEAPPPLKIFFVGGPRCPVADLLNKVTTVNTKSGPFDCCFIVGDLLQVDDDGSELAGLQFPIPTYFINGTRELPPAVRAKLDKGEVAPNLIGLGMMGALTTAQGLKIGWVGGKYDPSSYDVNEEVTVEIKEEYAEASIEVKEEVKAESGSHIAKNELQALLTQPSFAGHSTGPTSSLKAAREARPEWQHGMDVLVLSQAPPEIATYSKVPPSSKLEYGPPEVAEVIKRTRPRYVVWPSADGFWEREPFVWKSFDGSIGDRTTRAVMMAPFAPAAKGEKKPKSLYAFSLPIITPTTPPIPAPAGVTPNPYSQASARGVKRPLEDQNFLWGNMNGTKRGKSDGPPPPTYTCHKCQQPGHWIQDCPLRAQAGMCRKCGSHDHQTKDCTNPKPDGPPPESYVCKLCQQPGHWIQDCSQASQTTPRAGGGIPPPDYKCNACEAVGEHYIRECPKVIDQNERKKAKQHVTDMECWFCLSGKHVAKHLVVAIESESYVALPKGSLVPSSGSAASLVPGGGHVLIIPIGHHQTLSTIPIDEAIPIMSEIGKFKSRLRAMYNDFGAVPVSFEVARLAGKGGHAHIQVVPVPARLKDQVKQAFLTGGQEMNVEWEENPDPTPKGNYFKVELPTGEIMVHKLRGPGFNLQFGRIVLAKLLGLESRTDWRNCGETDAQQTADAAAFRKAFKKYE